MLFWLQESFRHYFSALNVIRYVSFRVIAATVTALVICLLLYPWFIRKLTRQSIGQTIRDDGPERHHAKQGTPTMGGSLMLIALFVSTILWNDLSNPFVWFLLFIAFGFGIVGFIDDYQKLRYKNSKGLKGKYRLLIEFGICAVVFFFFAWQYGLVTWEPVQGITDVLNGEPARWTSRGMFSTELYIPFLRSDQHWINMPAWLYFPFISIVIVGTANAVNLTDGLDGLAIGPTITASAAFLVFSYLTAAKLGGFDITRYLLIPKIYGANELSIICGSVLGAGIGFLWYNTYPAQVFMGDVGALSLGSILGTLAVLTKNELLSVIIFGIFFLEAISVITQTVSFKLTGKRVFRMAPIHHHFELKGWAEPKIIVRFWIISIMLVLIAFATIKIR